MMNWYRSFMSDGPQKVKLNSVFSDTAFSTFTLMTVLAPSQINMLWNSQELLADGIITDLHAEYVLLKFGHTAFLCQHDQYKHSFLPC